MPLVQSVPTYVDLPGWAPWPGYLVLDEPGNVALGNRRNALWKEDMVNVVHLVNNT
jgi:hypothetical protein